MYIGEQLGDLSDRKLTWAAQMGVEHLAVNSTITTGIENPDGTWELPVDGGTLTASAELSETRLAMLSLALAGPALRGGA